MRSRLQSYNIRFKKLESEKHCLEEELEDLKVEYEDLEDKFISFEKANKCLLAICNQDEEKIEDLHKFNRELVKNNKVSNRDFFILAVAYASTLMLMIYLFIR